MIRFIKASAWTAAVLGLNLAADVSRADTFFTGKPPSAANAPVPEKKDKDKDEDVITLKEKGKSDRNCILIMMKQQPDNSTIFYLRAVDDGEIITLRQRPGKEAERIHPGTPSQTTKSTDKTAAKTANVGSADASPVRNLPRLKDSSTDASLNPSGPETATMAIPATTATAAATATPTSPVSTASEKPARRGLWNSLFGSKSKPSCDAPGDCTTGVAVGTASGKEPPLIAPILPPRKFTQDTNSAGQATIGPVKPVADPGAPGTAKIEAPRQTSIQDPPATAKAISPAPPMPSPIAATGLNAMPRLPMTELQKMRELKQRLKSAPRPSQRITAAEDLVVLAPDYLREVRAALLSSAQNDGAGCVRAACVHCLSKLRTRDQEFLTLLDIAKEDEDAEVREEVVFALNKINHK